MNLKKACSKNPVRYLLILCISLTPAIGPGAVEMPRMDHAAGGCPDCMPMDGATDSGCESESCLPVLHACGAASCSGPIPVNGQLISHRAYRVADHPAGAARVRSRRAEPIFRPPIA